jgi:hypothetical protein
VAKSYLPLLAGIAVADGLIADPDEPVGRTVDDGGFDGDYNRGSSWRHLLQQTSEWEGSLFSKPDQIDRNRVVSYDGQASKGAARRLREPGAYWEYNDVRVSRLSLALLRRVRPSAAGGLRRAHSGADRRLARLEHDSVFLNRGEFPS